MPQFTINAGYDGYVDVIPLAEHEEALARLEAERDRAEAERDRARATLERIVDRPCWGNKAGRAGTRVSEDSLAGPATDNGATRGEDR